LIVTVGPVGLGVDAVYVTDKVSVPEFPAASNAVIVITLVPLWSEIPEMLQFVVPLATPLPPRSFDHRTCVTPTLSDAVPLNEVIDELVEYVVPLVGEPIVTVGRVVSGVPPPVPPPPPLPE
jgi:hypothetical protein